MPNSKHEALVALLKAKSERLNLFSSADREKLMDKHLPDALAVCGFWKPQPGARVMDLGTGGGLPGLVLALERPDVNFTLVDARDKKLRAVQEVADELGLENVQTVHGRFEELAHGEMREAYDVLVARAVAPLPVLLEYAAGFLNMGGDFYAWKSSNYEAELEASRGAQALVGLELEGVHDYELPGGEARCILHFKKTAPLEAEYPRRSGVPKRRPL